MIQCRLVDRPDLDRIELYLWVDTSGGRHEFIVDPDIRQLVLGDPIRQGDAMRPTLVLRTEELGVLTEALRRSGPHGSVEADALVDARAVRDRLLVMVERSFDAHLAGRMLITYPDATR